MDKSSDFSARCSHLFHGVQAATDISVAEFNLRCGFPKVFRQPFRRLLLGQRKTGWTQIWAEQAAAASSGLINMPLDIIRDRLNGKPLDPEYENRFREIERSHIWLPRATAALTLRVKLEKYEQGGKTNNWYTKVPPGESYGRRNLQTLLPQSHGRLGSRRSASLHRHMEIRVRTEEAVSERRAARCCALASLDYAFGV
jgi:hypothetical protein